jgi:hypothetical protein
VYSIESSGDVPQELAPGDSQAASAGFGGPVAWRCNDMATVAADGPPAAPRNRV